MEYLWTDVEGEKRMFDIRSNFDSVRIELDPSAITILEADGNLVPVHLLPMEIPSYVADMAE